LVVRGLWIGQILDREVHRKASLTGFTERPYPVYCHPRPFDLTVFTPERT